MEGGPVGVEVVIGRSPCGLCQENLATRFSARGDQGVERSGIVVRGAHLHLQVHVGNRIEVYELLTLIALLALQCSF